MTTEEIIKAIITEKDRYSDIKELIDPQNEANYLQELMEIRKQLSCLSLDLSIKTGRFLREFKKYSSIVNTKRYLELDRLMSSGEKVTAAEAKAKSFVVADVKAENQWESEYMSCKIILGQVNEVLASIKQDISIIKRDYEGMSEREN